MEGETCYVLEEHQNANPWESPGDPYASLFFAIMCSAVRDVAMGIKAKDPREKRHIYKNEMIYKESVVAYQKKLVEEEKARRWLAEEMSDYYPVDPDFGPKVVRNLYQLGPKGLRRFKAVW